MTKELEALESRGFAAWRAAAVAAAVDCANPRGGYSPSEAE
jgi:hypothetical protein